MFHLITGFGVWIASYLSMRIVFARNVDFYPQGGTPLPRLFIIGLRIFFLGIGFVLFVSGAIELQDGLPLVKAVIRRS